MPTSCGPSRPARSGYLLKDAPTAVLADAIRRAARGETVLAPPVAARLADRLRAPAGPS